MLKGKGSQILSADDLRKEMKCPNLPVVEYPASDGRTKLFIDIQGGVFVTLPCPLSKVHNAIVDAVVARFLR